MLRLHISEVYRWLLSKLMQMGMLSRSEQMAEADLLNPLASTMGASMNGVLR